MMVDQMGGKLDVNYCLLWVLGVRISLGFDSQPVKCHVPATQSMKVLSYGLTNR